jgi:hypothetical protein
MLIDNNLRISPLGVLPQRNRRPRTMCDYSFFFVNIDTIPLAPEEYMKFGRALWRILQQISDIDPRLGPVHLSKIDIADEFYRIAINANDVPKLGVMLPTAPRRGTLGRIPAGPPHGMDAFPVFVYCSNRRSGWLGQSKLDEECPLRRSSP